MAKIEIWPIRDEKTLYRILGIECRDFVRGIVGLERLDVFWVDQRFSTRSYLSKRLLQYLASSFFKRPQEVRNYHEVMTQTRNKYMGLIDRFVEDHAVILVEIGICANAKQGRRTYA